MPVRNFTPDRMPALLDFVESTSTWGDNGRDLGRRTFEETLSQPGLNPQANCVLLENGDGLQGYCLLFPEIAIGRTVLQLKLAPNLAGTSSEKELLLSGLEMANSLAPRVIHLCLYHPSPTENLLKGAGFSLVRSYWDMLWRHDSLAATALPDGFSVRSFQPGDAALLAEVQNSAFAASWGFCPNTAEQIEYRTSMANTSPQGILFLNHGEQTAGYCWTCLVPVQGSLRGVIGMIGVVPDYRGKGVSRAILTAGMEHLRSLDVADIALEVDSTNTPGVRLYTSVGLEKVGEIHWFERGLS